MANNVYCVFLKFCVFCLIFVELSQTNEINSDLYHLYNIENSHSLKHLGKAEFQSYRAKRDTNGPSAPIATVPSSPSSSSSSSTSATTKTPDTSKTDDSKTQHLLGENGAGQRKYYPPTNDMKTPTVIVPETSSPLNSPTNKTVSKNKSLGAIPPPTKITEVEDILPEVNEKIIGEIDEPDEIINKTISDEIKKIEDTMKRDYFQYYNSTTTFDKNSSDEYWSDIQREYITSSILSKSHRRAITVQLKFDFPFYGHIVRNVTVATGGFLYTGEYVHSWLAATQYIAPLMANFDTSMSNVSTVKYSDNGTALTVIWDKVPLQDGNQSKSSLFTFSVTLYNTGDITFAYKDVPILIENIRDEKHPVKIGLSDAYIIDKTIYFARRKTIYEYHRVNFDGQDIKNDTIIKLKANPTCLDHTDCASCLDSKIKEFNCTWCPAINRCSTGTDRKRQQWLAMKCEQSHLTDTKTCPALGTKGNNFASQQTVTTPSLTPTNQNEQQNSSGTESSATSIPNKTSSNVSKAALAHIDSSKNINDKANKGSHASFALSILLPIIFLACMVMWVFYAYRNPHTKSGQLLIQYRPSQWSWRRGEARYTAATIHM